MVRQTIQIFARVKPTKKPTAVYTVDNEEHSGGSLEFVIPRDLADGFINNKRESYRFRFLKVFDQATNQEEIFETIAKPVADNVLAGYNGTIFAYGQTGSGKTFTITGGAERYSDRGIIPRTLSYLYHSMVYTTQISYLEIYNEVGYDLLDPRHEASNLEDLPKVTIMEDPDQNIHLKNLSLQASANEEEALNLLFLGDTNRMIAETPMNQASTRSHCIFTIHLCGREPGSATLHRSKLHLVDLAGSERVGKSGVGGQILTEAKYINLSLHYLEQVITALSEKNRSHIPYRNSMMTSVLRDSLGGNCMTTMIATVSSEKTNIDVRFCPIFALSSSGLADRQASEAQGDLLKLKDILTQRDNEISILCWVYLVALCMLWFSPLFHMLDLKAQNTHFCSASSSGPELSIEQQEAFEIFRNDHGDRLTLEDNKAILKQRFAEAKALGEQVNQARNRVSKSFSLPPLPPPNPQSDTVEETLRSQIEEEKKNYKSTFGRLKGLKTEIEHLQHLLQRSKIKLKRDFQDWWSQEATRLQYWHHALHYGIPYYMLHIPFRALSSTTMSSTSIPLTGDHQTDADILAFIRARQSLLTRTGISSSIHAGQKRGKV
uniref:Kinesin-like protein n=1 Tax=Electrophorus electricus TaxID=8005 RepID=A0A4W4EMC3_ELEEL